MIKLLILIGLLLPTAYAAEDDTLYKKVKTLMEFESQHEEAALPDQRFAIGVYHDDEIDTNDSDNDIVPFEIQKEEYVDFSLQERMRKMCGHDDSLKNDLMTCLMVQSAIRNVIQRNAWLRKLGRDLQAIASGYEMGIDGYSNKPVDIIGRFSSITHLWGASNDPFALPFSETLTQARPLPKAYQEMIIDDAKKVVERLKDLIRKWTAEGGEKEDEKEDQDDMVAAIRRYRHGVQYVIDREGPCEDAPEYPENPANVWLERRWCDLEYDLLDILDTLQFDEVEFGNDRQIIYPGFVDKDNNIYIWMRYDDIGLQWYIPLEPVQAALYHPDFGDCLDGDSARNCYDTYSEFIVRGGIYPSKLGDDQKEDQPYLGLDAKGQGPNNGGGDDDDDEEEIKKNNSIVPEPKEGDGICSHPFGKSGYLCRGIEYEACDLTKDQEEELEQYGTGGIILTRCQPERFKDDVTRKVSGSNICGIGGWRETVEENVVKDTPERQPDMRPNKCASCAADVECLPLGEKCTENGGALTSYIIKNNVFEICVPNSTEHPHTSYYLLAHELIHAQQGCTDSNLQLVERIGLRDESKKDPGACCASEREAYFVQCKLYALDGILDKAGITIDQCASAFANFSCSAHDDDEEDDDYVCSNDGIDPDSIAKIINDSALEMLENGSLDIPTTCEDALDDPRIQAIYNSFPLACRPGCQAAYDNTIGNNLCYTGQCLEETNEWARDIPGRMGLTVVDEDFPWDSCEGEDPNLGKFEVPPAITAPKFPLYRPALMLQELDHALCQINGLPARTPPVLCGFDPTKRLGLPPLTFLEAVDDLRLQPDQYDATGLGIQYAASAIGSRIATDMFTQYLSSGARQFADILNTMHHVLDGIGNLEFPSQMCSRYSGGNATCPQQ